MKREIKDIKFWEAWMTSNGYSIDFDKYGLWAEDYVEEHRWKDIFEMMMQYASEEIEKIQEQIDDGCRELEEKYDFD